MRDRFDSPDCTGNPGLPAFCGQLKGILISGANHQTVVTRTPPGQAIKSRPPVAGVERLKCVQEL